MIKKTIITISSLVLVIVMMSMIIGACRKNENPNGLQMVQQVIPAGFPTPVNNFRDNPLSTEGIALGRRLFYDGMLSVDGNFPCASCHQQIGSFGTFQHDRSHGYNGSHTLRNAPPLFNLAWQNNFHWDGEFKTLFDEATQPINGHIEMASSFDIILERLQADQSYREEFKKVFRSQFIQPEHVLKALAQFTGTIISANSRYDRYKKGEITYTAQELNGYQVFLANCASCHPEPMFTDYSFHNTGLPVDNFLNDQGRVRVTNNPLDVLKFKTPTLRNVNLSANYMHDGRFNTLAQSINHYRTGIVQSPTLDPLLVNGISLTNSQATDLAQFLRSLSDSSILTDPRYSTP